MEDKKRDLDIFKLALKDIVYKAVRDFGYEKTLSAIVSLAMNITEKEVKKRKEAEDKNKEEGVKK